MPRDPRSYLEDVATASAHICRLTSGYSLKEYLADDVTRWAVERQFTILGEALFQLRNRFPQVADQIPESRRIVNFRHVLIHGYAEIQDDIVWGIIESDLVSLHDCVKRLLNAS